MEPGADPGEVGGEEHRRTGGVVPLQVGAESVKMRGVEQVREDLLRWYLRQVDQRGHEVGEAVTEGWRAGDLARSDDCGVVAGSVADVDEQREVVVYVCHGVEP